MTKGRKVGSFAWNHRHLEAYFAVPCAGAVLHMINIRLAPKLNHAEDEILLVDSDLYALMEPLMSKLTTVEKIIIMQDEPELPQAPTGINR